MMAARESVLLTGATGFTGGYVLRRLLDANYPVTAFVRSRIRAEGLRDRHRGIMIAEGDFDDPGSFLAAVRGHDTLVNVASLGFGHAPTIVACAQSAGVRRAVFFSTTALFTTLPAETKARRQLAEDLIRRASSWRPQSDSSDSLGRSAQDCACLRSWDIPHPTGLRGGPG